MKERICLKCRKEFNSKGVANRICCKCTEENNGLRLSQREPTTGSGNRKKSGVQKDYNC